MSNPVFIKVNDIDGHAFIINSEQITKIHLAQETSHVIAQETYHITLIDGFHIALTEQEGQRFLDLLDSK